MSIFAMHFKIKRGAIAQLVEQRTENPCVPGSIPGGTTDKKSKIEKTPESQRFQGFFFFCKSTKWGKKEGFWWRNR